MQGGQTWQQQQSLHTDRRKLQMMTKVDIRMPATGCPLAQGDMLQYQ